MFLHLPFIRTNFRVAPLMNPAGHFYPSHQGRASVYCVRLLHSLHRGPAASAGPSPLLCPVGRYVVCASLCALHRMLPTCIVLQPRVVSGLLATVSVWSRGWILTPQGLMGPQDQERDSQQGNKLENRLRPTDVSSMVETSQLSSDCTLQSPYATFKRKTLVTLNYFTVTVTLFRFN